MDPYDGLAKVWILLQTRVDMTSIVREIIGHFALSLVGSSPSIDLSFSFFIWIKVIFDLQRTYSQSAEPSPESQSYLLSPRTLFKATRHVLQTKVRIYSQRRDMDPNYLEQRYFVARVLHSGLRALQLRERQALLDISITEIGEIHTLVRNWREEADGIFFEQFILDKCLVAISNIQQHPTPTSVWHKPACGSCELRDNQIGLYEVLESKVIRSFDAQLTLLQTESEPRDPPFWALYDILWATEVGYIQWRADKLSGEDVSEYTCESGILAGKLKSVAPEEKSSSVLLQSWSLDLKSSVPLRSPSSIGYSLDTFHQFLLGRQKELVDYNLAIKSLSIALQENIESWIRQESEYKRSENLRGEEQLPLQTAYVLECPRLHIVPAHVLQSLIDKNKHEIFNKPKLLNLEAHNITCPRCPERLETTVVKHARMVEPLQQMSEKLRNLIDSADNFQNLGQSGQPDDSDNVEPTQVVQTLPNIRLSSSENSLSESPLPLTPLSAHTPPILTKTFSMDPSPSIDANPSKKERRGTFSLVPIFSRKTTGRPKKTSPVEISKDKLRLSFKSYCFSSDGKTLILWNRGEDFVFASLVPTQDGSESAPMWKWNRFPVPNVRWVAGGATTVASVSVAVDLVSKRMEQRLLVFSTSTYPAAEPIARISISKDKIWSINVSTDDKWVALGSDRELSVYNVNMPQLSPGIAKLSRQPNLHISSQRVNFSRDANKVVIATGQSDSQNSQIDIVLFDNSKSQELWNRISTKPVGITHNEHGLSSVFYDDERDRLILTAYVNKPYTFLYSEFKGLELWQTQNGKLQAAVQRPSGSQFVLLNDSGQLYQFDSEKKTIRILKNACFKHTPGSNSQFVALAAPENDCIYAFWVEKDGMVFETIRGESNPVRKKFVAPPQDS